MNSAALLMRWLISTRLVLLMARALQMFGTRKLRESLSGSEEGTSLPFLLELFQGFDYSDPRDKIYAPANLAVNFPA
jgi:hypothetical protein